MANSLPAIYRLRVTRRLALLAALFSVLILPLNAVAIGGTQTICIDSWYATVCADNNGSSYTEQVSIFLGPNDFNGSLVANSSGDTVDISASSFTDAGSGAVVAILNVDTLFMNLENSGTTAQKDGLLNVYTMCQTSDAPTCQAAVKAFFPSLSEDQIKSASTWWHGCQHASDDASKSFTGLSGQLGYAIGAMTKGGSNASITANITHHLGNGQTQTQRVCAPQQTGKMPAAGHYNNEVVGHISMNVTSPNGGTLSNKTVTVWSPVAQGTFAVDASGTIRFTGTVTGTKCVQIPRPQPIPTPIQ
jgi:hypothetical protein